MTERGIPRSESNPDSAGVETAVACVRERSERVRRRELETALRRLEAEGEVTSSERRAVARLSTRLTDSLVEGWAARLDEADVDPEAALALLGE